MITMSDRYVTDTASSCTPACFYFFEKINLHKVFIIGPDKKVKLSILYPASCGRNFDEVLRALDSLQMTVNHKVATPVNWQKGAECMVLPSVQDADVGKLFPKGVRIEGTDVSYQRCTAHSAHAYDSRTART